MGGTFGIAGSFSQWTTANAAARASTPPPSDRAALPRTALLADVGHLPSRDRRPRGSAPVVLAVIVPVVPAVVVGVLLDLRAVQHDAEQAGAGLPHALERVAYAVAGDHLRSDHHHDAVREGPEDQRLGHRPDGRRVEDDPVVEAAQPVEEV